MRKLPVDPKRRKRVTTAPCAPHPASNTYTPAEAAFLLGVSTVTLARWRTMGTGPAFMRPSPRIVRYGRAAVDAFLGQSFASTTAADHAAKAK